MMLFLLLPLLCFAAFIAYCFVSAMAVSNKEYCLPQIKTYLKVYKPTFKEYGYILFSKDSIFQFSDKVDFVKINKSETSWVSFVFNPLEHNKIFVVDRFDNAIKINQVNYIIEKINREDTTFFEEHIVAGTHTYLLKPPYISISVEGYLQSVFFTDYHEEYSAKIKPIK